MSQGLPGFNLAQTYSVEMMYVEAAFEEHCSAYHLKRILFPFKQENSMVITTFYFFIGTSVIAFVVSFIGIT